MRVCVGGSGEGEGGQERGRTQRTQPWGMAGEVMISAQSVKEKSAEHFHINRARGKGTKDTKMQNPEEIESKHIRGQMLVLLRPPTQLTVLAESKAETCKDNIYFLSVEWRPSSLLPAQRVC